jgi:AcrR family transcriptional regulator
VTEPGTGRQRLLDAAVGYFAEHGVADTSLRHLAAQIGTSHRMLLYHFGSREGLLGAVVDAVETAQRATLLQLADEAGADPLEQSMRFWRAVTEAALVYGPLFFELSGHAMQGRPHAGALRNALVEPWLEPLARLWIRRGRPAGAARVQARLDLAVARGLLYDLLITGDRAGVDAALAAYVAHVRPGG